MQECQKRLEHKLSLDAYLLKPVQRITKYQLMLKARLFFIIGEIELWGLLLDFGLKSICHLLGDAEMQQELRRHSGTGRGFGYYAGHHKVSERFNAPDCHHWL